MAACALVMNLQSIVSRGVAPTDIAVVSVTEIFTDGVRNALPGSARILGDTRSFSPDVSQRIETQMRRIAQGTADAYGVVADVSYTREFVPTINDSELTNAVLKNLGYLALKTLKSWPHQVAGRRILHGFWRMCRGVLFIWAMAYNPSRCTDSAYDFDDAGLIHGAQFHAAIAGARVAQISAFMFPE